MSRLRRGLGRVRRLSWVEAVYLVRVVGAATVVTGLLEALPLPRVAGAMAAGGSAVRLPSAARMVRLTDRILAMDRGPLRPNCVIRSMVLLRYLGRAEGEVALVAGVRPDVRPVDGHAWIERQGLPFAEARDPREHYIVTWTWP